jgi:hypothetical protein
MRNISLTEEMAEEDEITEKVLKKYGEICV